MPNIHPADPRRTIVLRIPKRHPQPTEANMPNKTDTTVATDQLGAFTPRPRPMPKMQAPAYSRPTIRLRVRSKSSKKSTKRMRPKSPFQAMIDLQSRFRLLRSDLSILTIEGVAYLLATTPNFVRSIPVTELPRVRIGQRLLFMRDDVDTFVEGRRNSLRKAPGADELVRDAASRVLKSKLGSGRRPGKGGQ